MIFRSCADKWQTVAHFILPAARPGILTGAIVGLSRAVGETAPVITIGALTYIAFLPNSPLQSDFPFLNFDWLNSAFTVMPIQMFNWLSRPQSDFHINAAATGLVLKVMTFLMNLRSEEHTSEIQSLMRSSYAVLRLKKQKETIKKQEG